MAVRLPLLKIDRIRKLLVPIQANNFWTTMNDAALSALVYMRDARSFPSHHKFYILWTPVIFGAGICLSWTSCLVMITRQIELKNSMLMEMQRYFPIPLFKTLFAKNQVKPRLTLKEKVVPLLFIGGYLFFTVLLFFFPEDITAILPN